MKGESTRTCKNRAGSVYYSVPFEVATSIIEIEIVMAIVKTRLGAGGTHAQVRPEHMIMVLVVESCHKAEQQEHEVSSLSSYSGSGSDRYRVVADLN